jgi:hypothetical protein
MNYSPNHFYYSGPKRITCIECSDLCFSINSKPCSLKICTTLKKNIIIQLFVGNGMYGMGAQWVKYFFVENGDQRNSQEENEKKIKITHLVQIFDSVSVI